MTVKGDPALSHFTVGLPLCDKEQAVVSYTPDYAVSIGLDPTSGVSGIKWDIGLKPGESRLYSFTLKGDIAAGTTNVAVKAGTFVALGSLTSPSCAETPKINHYDIAGVLFVDANHNGVKDDGEPILPNVTIEIRDLTFNVSAHTLTNKDGQYLFESVGEGSYAMTVTNATENTGDFNEVLFSLFEPTTANPISIKLAGSDSLENHFGFSLNVADVPDDFTAEDPDADGVVFKGTGKTIGFWKHQITVAIQGKGRAQIDVPTVQSNLLMVERLYLPDPFQFTDGKEKQHALTILSSTSSNAVDLLKKQLLGTELNDVSGMGLSGAYEALQDALIAWGEYLVLHNGQFTREDLLAAKDIFDHLNNTGEW